MRKIYNWPLLFCLCLVESLHIWFIIWEWMMNVALRLDMPDLCFFLFPTSSCKLYLILFLFCTNKLHFLFFCGTDMFYVIPLYIFMEWVFTSNLNRFTKKEFYVARGFLLGLHPSPFHIQIFPSLAYIYIYIYTQKAI